MIDPIEKFNRWWDLAKVNSPLKQKNAICLSTINQSGYPSARFVDLKKASNEGFIFCSYLNAKKGYEISENPNVALTAWWDHCGFQIRVTGMAQLLSNSENDKYWSTRAHKAQLTTSVSNQSQLLDNEEGLIEKFLSLEKEFQGKKIPRPANWGGYQVNPISIEFLTFRESRLHLRELFELKENEWCQCLLQP